MGTIPIYKGDIPYTFEIELSGKIYTIDINYNFIFDFFTITLKLNDNVLVEDEKLILNQQLFKDLYVDVENNIDIQFPQEKLIPLAKNKDLQRINFEDLGETVQIYYFKPGEEVKI